MKAGTENRSLQRHLTQMIGLMIVLFGLVSGLLSFYFAYGEAQEFQDDILRQMTSLWPGRTAKIPEANSQQSSGLADEETRVLLFHFPDDPRPAWLPADLKPGFHSLDSPSGKMRLYLRTTAQAGTILAAQPTDARDELALYSAIRTLLPLLLLIPFMVWIIARVVSRELSPVTNLSQRMDSQPVLELRSLSLDRIPTEILPFVKSINRLLDRVRRLMGEQTRFIADAAHELRSPLTALSVQIENVKKSASVPEMLERMAPLREGIERSRRMTEQLLALAKTQALAPESKALNISQLCRELVAEFIPLAEHSRIDLGLEDSGAVLSLKGEPEFFRVLIKNALENAIRYTPAGGCVTLVIRQENLDAVIEVMDTGPGIPAKDRENVFQPFYRLEGTKEMGSGLGLAIAKDAAARLGGKISLLDSPQLSGLLFSYRQPNRG